MLTNVSHALPSEADRVVVEVEVHANGVLPGFRQHDESSWMPIRLTRQCCICNASILLLSST